MAVAQVLELLTDQNRVYVRYLLSHDDYPYRGDAERLISALLEGTAPSPADVQAASAAQAAPQATTAPAPKVDEFAYTKERRNIWDEEKMDLSQVRIGKKRYIQPTTARHRDTDRWLQRERRSRSGRSVVHRADEGRYPQARRRGVRFRFRR